MTTWHACARRGAWPQHLPAHTSLRPISDGSADVARRPLLHRRRVQLCGWCRPHLDHGSLSQLPHCTRHRHHDRATDTRLDAAFLERSIGPAGESVRWIIYGGALFLVTLAPLVRVPDEPTATASSVSMTMAFVVLGFGTLLSGLAERRDPETGLNAPILKAIGILGVPALVIVVTTTWTPLQELLTTQPLTGAQCRSRWVLLCSFSVLLRLRSG